MPPVDFSATYIMENLRGQRHEALHAGPHSGVEYNSVKRIFEPIEGVELPSSERLKELYVEYYEAEKMFEESVVKFQRKHQKHATTATNWEACESAMLRACHVMEEAAKKDKEDDVRGFVGRLRKTMRSFCNHAKDANAFLAFIPSQSSYTSVLCGGLKVIFEAAEQVGYHRKTVYEHLEQLPNIFSKKSRKLEVFADSERLHKLMSLLSATILEHLAYIMEWFMKNPGRVSIRSIWQPKSYCDKLADYMAQVKLRAEDFDDEVSTLEMKEAREHRVKFDLMERRIRALALNSVHENFQSTITENSATPQIANPEQDSQMNVQQEDISQKLLDKFQYDQSLTDEDSQTLLRAAASINKKDESRVIYLIQNIRLQAWLRVDETSTLFIVGNAHHRTKSPTSLVCARLVAAAAENVNMIVTAFFCGQHTDALSDVNACPSELAMSILLQLVDQYRGFEAELIAGCMETLDPESPKSICKAIGRFVKALPPTKVWFCVVDAIGFFSDRDRRDAMLFVLRYLVKATRKSGSGRVKLLVSIPGRWKEAEDYFDMDEVLVVPSVCSPGGKLTESKWSGVSVEE